MMTQTTDFNFHSAPVDKKQYIYDIGKILVRNFGKKSSYKPEEVKTAHQESTWRTGMDYSSWAMSVFCRKDSFDKYHNLRTERRDYYIMNKKMLPSPSTSRKNNSDSDESWFDIFDLSEGIGEMFDRLFDD